MIENWNVETILSPIINAAERNQRIGEKDYRNEEGILVCGVCGEPKEALLTFNNRKVPCMCRCDIERERKQAEKQRLEEDRSRLDQIRKASLMDKIFEKAVFDNFSVTQENARNYKLCRRYAEHFDEMLNKNQGLLFYGDVGTGKSFAAACIANYLLDRGVPVIMTSVQRIVTLISSEGEKELDVLGRLNKAKLVIFDDLGVERNSDYVIEKTYSIIDSRIRCMLPMIVTTNIPFEKMKHEMNSRYKRIYERILANSHPMNFEGVSWRMKEAYNRAEEMEEYKS